MKGTLASPAVALASNVLPVPGGPVNIAPTTYVDVCNQHVYNLIAA